MPPSHGQLPILLHSWGAALQGPNSYPGVLHGGPFLGCDSGVCCPSCAVMPECTWPLSLTSTFKSACASWSRAICSLGQTLRMSLPDKIMAPPTLAAFQNFLFKVSDLFGRHKDRESSIWWFTCPAPPRHGPHMFQLPITARVGSSPVTGPSQKIQCKFSSLWPVA